MEQVNRVAVLLLLLVVASLALSACDPLRLLPGPTIQTGVACSASAVSQVKPDATLE